MMNALNIPIYKQTKPDDCTCDYRPGYIGGTTGHAWNCPAHLRLRDLNRIEPLTEEKLEHLKREYCFQSRGETTWDSINLYAAPAICEVDSPRRNEATDLIVSKLIEIGFISPHPTYTTNLEGGWYKINRQLKTYYGTVK